MERGRAANHEPLAGFDKSFLGDYSEVNLKSLKVDRLQRKEGVVSASATARTADLALLEAIPHASMVTKPADMSRVSSSDEAGGCSEKKPWWSRPVQVAELLRQRQ